MRFWGLLEEERVNSTLQVYHVMISSCESNPKIFNRTKNYTKTCSNKANQTKIRSVLMYVSETWRMKKKIKEKLIIAVEEYY